MTDKILIDIDYQVKDGLPVIRKWYKIGDEVKIEYDDEFEPYFYAWAEDLATAETKLKNLKVKRNGDILEIKRIERVTRNDLGKPKEVLKIITYLPSHVPVFRDEAERLRLKLWECDIVFQVRYLINKNLEMYK